MKNHKNKRDEVETDLLLGDQPYLAAASVTGRSAVWRFHISFVNREVLDVFSECANASILTKLKLSFALLYSWLVDEFSVKLLSLCSLI